MLGHKVERKGDIDQRHRARDSEIQQIAAADLEKIYDQHIIANIKRHISIGENRRGRARVLGNNHLAGRIHHVGHDRVAAKQAAHAIAEIRQQISDAQRRLRIDRGDAEENGKEKLKEAHPSVEVHDIHVVLTERHLLVHGAERHRNARGDQHAGPDELIVGATVRVLFELGQQRHDEPANDEQRAHVVVALIRSLEQHLGHHHAHRNGSLQQQHEQRARRNVCKRKQLHDGRDRVQSAHDGKHLGRHGALRRLDGSAIAYCRNNVGKVK